MHKLRKLVSLLVAAAVAVSVGLAALYLCAENYVFLCGSLHRRDTEQLDLRGTKLSRLENVSRFTHLRSLDLRGTGLTGEEYALLTELLPQCTILWDVAFQGKFLPQDAENLTLTTLTAEEVALLDMLPGLLYVDAENCEDYALLMDLQQRHPDCYVSYSVTIGEEEWDCQVAELTLCDADCAELAEKLAYLPELQAVTLTGQLPDLEELSALQEQYPSIRVRAETVLGPVSPAEPTNQLTVEAGTEMTLSQVEAALEYFPALIFADMSGSGLSDGDMMHLSDTFPDITFLWDMTIAGVAIPTDSTEIDLSGYEVTDLAAVEAALPYFPNLEKVVMCGCGIDSETMDALNKRYEDIRFVWSVYLGNVLLRTDATYFMPVKWGAQVTTEDLYNLCYCTDIVCVDIGHMDVSSCEWAAYMPNLKYLLMADTQVSDLTPLENLKNLEYLELFLTQVRDLTPLVGCTALKDINLCYTYADPTPLLQMPWLQNIWWSGHWAVSYNAHLFREMNPDIRLEYTTVSSTGGGWRELPNYYAMRDLVGMGYMVG